MLQYLQEVTRYGSVYSSIKEGYTAHGIRLDLYVTDEAGAVYNVEVQTTNKLNLPKRMRYYQSAIDINVLSPGVDYSKLSKSYIIFICSYDPYRRNRYLYRFENRCVDEPDLAMGDETVKIIVNTRGTEGAISDEMKEIIRYLGDGSVGGDFTQDLDDAVRHVKSSKDRRHEYMVMMIHEQEIKRQGIEEGRKEGEVRYNELIRRLFSLNRVQDAMRITEDPDYRQQLYAEFGI